jgi:chitinase
MVSLCLLGAGSAFAAPAWQPDVYYTAGTQVSYNGATYSALVNQTDYSATGWNPTTASLWTLVSGSSTGSSGSGSTGSGSTGTGSSGSGGATSGSCAAAWSATAVYTGGMTASENSTNYLANWWTQGNDPASSSGPTGSGQPWTSQGSCSGGSGSGSGSGGTGSGGTGTGGGGTGTGGTGPSSPPPSFVFSPFKDITISMNWNTNVISSAVTGTLQPVTSVMPTNNTTLTWAFATGECGSEGWAGLTPTQVASNVQAFVSAGKKYIISTGGQAGVFTCGSDAGFDTFVQKYISANMIGVDFDIEGGQSADVINNLVARVKVAKGKYPNLRFSFTLQTLGGNSGGLNQLGNEVMSAIQSTGLTGYIIDLMAMDYGSTGPGNCVVVNGACEMGQSAIQAVELLHSGFGVPYNQIELTPDIGGNDTQGETFTLADARTISAYALQKGLAGIHFWSFDRDNDCAPGSSSPTCNAYGQAGRLGFTTSFLSDLGL